MVVTKRKGRCAAAVLQSCSPRDCSRRSQYPKRLSLLVRVAEGAGPSTVSHVAKGSGVDLSVVSRHLSVLREAGIIKCEKHGKEVLCTLQTNVVVRILRQLADALESCCPEKGLPEGSGDAPSPPPPRTRSTRPKKP